MRYGGDQLIWIVVFISIVAIGIAVFVNNAAAKRGKAAAERGVEIRQTCVACSAPLEMGEFKVRYGGVFKTGDGKNLNIGAARCTNCGRIEFFA